MTPSTLPATTGQAKPASTRALAGLVVTLALVAGSACEGELGPERGQDPVERGTEAPTLERPAIELVGCRERQGPRCHLAAGTAAVVVAWLDLHPGARVEVRVDGRPLAVAPLAIDGGLRIVVELPATAQRVELEGLEPRWTETWALEIVRETPSALVARARAQDPKAAVSSLRAGLEEAEPAARLEAMQLLRRYLVAGHEREALSTTEATAELAESLGRSRDFADAAAAAAFLHLSAEDLVGARAWTERLRGIAGASADEGAAEIGVWTDYQLGLLASRTGDLGAAVEHLDEARRAARRVGLVDEFIFASEILGVTYAELGRGAEASALIEEVLAQADDLANCKQRAELYANTGWASLLLAESGFEHHDPHELFDAQIALIGPGGPCPDPMSMSFARVNSALVAIAEHEYAEAWDWIAPLVFEQAPSYLGPWIEEVVAQIAVGSGRWELVPSILARPAPDASEPGLIWNASVRAGETLERLGLDEAALASYAKAEAVLAQTLASVGVSLGRELFLAGRQTSAERLVELLVGQGHTQEALCRARLARGRALRTLDRSSKIAAMRPDQRREREAKLSRYLTMQAELAAAAREDWAFSRPERAQRKRLRRERVAEAEALLDEALRATGGRDEAIDLGDDPCAGLPKLEPGHVQLVQFPSETGSWLFVADASGVGVIEAPDPAAGPWPETILAPEAGRLAEAERIHVLPTGAGWSIDFHALRVGEGVLLELAPLVYSLDLGRADRVGPVGPGRALIVANPSENLANAEAEAEVVAARLAGGPWSIVQRVGAEVTRASLEAELREAELLHYAGHGVHRGLDGWQAALLLYDQDVLTVSDILALPRVPSGVVLTGCDTTSVAQGTLAGGMNLGRAFVLAGAQWVIGADGKVDDELARTIGEALYASARIHASGFDGPAALREAQLELRAQAPRGPWRAFRAVGR